MPDGSFEFDRRRAGVCLHLTSLPGDRGIGEIGASARRFLDWMQAQGLSVWQFLPTGPTGFGDSPYQPLSVFARNPWLIDIDELIEWGLLTRAEVASAHDDRPGSIDYQRVAATKGPLLALAAARFDEAPDSGLVREFEGFCEANDAVWLNDYVAFAMLKARYGNSAWPEWPERDRYYRPELVAGLADAFAVDWRRTKLIQFFFARQWRALRAEARQRNILLFGDVPIYTALDCAESWANRELLQLDDEGQPVEVAGVPPDYFSATGQLWGNPVYDWPAHAADGYQWWIARLRNALAVADMVRLDHFRGFHAYWAVPRRAATASDGEWREGPGGALFDAVAAALGRVPFVAEDLGIITEDVIALRRAYALPGMQVLQFMLDQPDFDADMIEEDCVCYTGTHDNDTTAGWFDGSQGRLQGRDLEAFQEIVRSNVEWDEERVHITLINKCFISNAAIAIAPMQDYLGLGSEARLNTPGRAEGNWRWRVAEHSLDSTELDFVSVLARETGRT